MSIGIDELFEMLNCNSDEKIQRRGIEEGKKIKTLSAFILPIEGMCYWKNCAKIIEQKTDEQLSKYLGLLLEWLQDEMWPGYDIIYSRIKLVSVKLIKIDYSIQIKEAIEQKNEKWLLSLIKLAENKELYESFIQSKYSTKKEKNIFKNYIKKACVDIKNVEK